MNSSRGNFEVGVAGWDEGVDKHWRVPEGKKTQLPFILLAA